ncbi:MAG TPA: AMP-binding protein [Fluviicola sp.]|nr:AMP-binding protein [Fluviicola sp.]
MTHQHYNIIDLFTEAAQRTPDRIAIIEGEKRISFSELDRQITAIAAYFQAKGIRKGDRVLVFVPMSIDLYRIVLALFRMGATAVFLDEWVSRERLDICCKVAQCRAWIGGWKVHFLSFLSKELRSMPVKLGLSYEDSFAFQPVVTAETDTALITFTTGSTGIPKAAKRTHGFLREQFSALIETIQPGENDVDMPVLPIVLMINLGIGCTSVIAPYKSSKPHTLKPELIIDLLKKHNVTRLVASPYFVKRVAERIIDQRLELPYLTKVFTGGAPVFPKEATLYKQAFPDALVEIVYGSTESEPISSIDAVEFTRSDDWSVAQLGGLPVGIPYHGTAVKIIRISDGPIQCNSPEELSEWEQEPQQIGEIIVSGKHVLREYINNEEALLRNKIFIGDECWHRTGDSGFFDGNGRLLLTGRCATLIEHNGLLIATFIVENELQLLEEVEMATLLKINNKMVAIVEFKRGASNNEAFHQKLKTKLPFLDELRQIRRMPRDPRHHSKVDYGKLKEVLGKQ